MNRQLDLWLSWNSSQCVLGHTVRASGDFWGSDADERGDNKKCIDGKCSRNSRSDVQCGLGVLGEPTNVVFAVTPKLG